MPQVQQSAFVLHRRPYRETSLLVQLLTPERGRVDAVVRGVRGMRPAQRQKQAWLQPFVPLVVAWREKGVDRELVSLRQFEPRAQAASLQGEALLCGFYMNELTLRLLPRQWAAPAVFHRYEAVLHLLAQSRSRAELAWLLRQYELTLLDALGLSLQPLEDARGEPVALDVRYRWMEGEGFVPSQRGISGECLRKLALQQFDARCMGAWKRLLRDMLRPWLGQRPLQTLKLIKP